MERWYLLITEKCLFWTFRWWEIRSFLSQEVGGKDELVLNFSLMEIRSFFELKSWWKMIFTGYREVFVLNFSVMGNTIVFSAKKLMERWYLLSLFELTMIFQDFENTVFRAVNSIRTVWNKWTFFIVFFVTFVWISSRLGTFVMYNNGSFEEN